jgi:hypothetical protein
MALLAKQHKWDTIDPNFVGHAGAAIDLTARERIDGNYDQFGRRATSSHGWFGATGHSNAILPHPQREFQP